jgi:hypothetical protein
MNRTPAHAGPSAPSGSPSPAAFRSSEPDSFAGLMSQLTQLTPPSVDENSSGAPVARRQSRPIHQLPKSKPEKSKTASEGARLSYEDAIRLHRRRPPDESELDTDFELDFKSPVARPSLKKAPASQEASSSKVAFGPRRVASGEASPARAEAVRQTASPTAEASNSSRRPEIRTRKPLDRSAAQARPDSPLTHASHTKKPAASRKLPALAAQGHSHRPAAAGADPAQRPTAGPHRIPSSRTQLAKRQTSADQATQSARVLAIETYPPQLELRRSIISLRLSEAEVDKLRQRAAESGISVSAYMRSCVLEAEHLRAQVKQALAEMRAASLHPGSALAVAGQARNSTGWSRFLARSAVFLFGPWLAWRTRT